MQYVKIKPLRKNENARVAISDLKKKEKYFFRKKLQNYKMSDLLLFTVS